MDHFSGSATAHLDATPSAVFDAITNVERLDEWNSAIERVLETPATLDTGAQWVIVMHPPRMPRWDSRATLTEIDRDTFRFTHRSQSDDGNPSYADWHWTVVPAAEGSELTVRWDVYPKTRARRLILARIRRPGLAREVERSLDDLQVHLQHARSADERS